MEDLILRFNSQGHFFLFCFCFFFVVYQNLISLHLQNKKNWNISVESEDIAQKVLEKVYFIMLNELSLAAF